MMMMMFVPCKKCCKTAKETQYTLSLYENIFYKNFKAEILRNFNNILRINPSLTF